MMGPTTAPPEADTGLETIEGIDLESAIPCMGVPVAEHDHPADLRVRVQWPACEHGTTEFICRDLWAVMDIGTVYCVPCGTERQYHRDDVATIVEVLR